MNAQTWSYAADFVKVPRALIAMLAAEPLALTLFLVLLDRARYQAGPAFTKHGIVELDVGEAVGGRAELAAACGANESTIRTAISRLQTFGIIAIKSTKRGSVVTLLRFKESYPPGHAQPPTESPTERQQNHQQNANRPPSESPLSEKADLRLETRDSRSHTAAVGVWTVSRSAKVLAAEAEAKARGADLQLERERLLAADDRTGPITDGRWIAWLRTARATPKSNGVNGRSPPIPPDEFPAETGVVSLTEDV